MPALQTTKAVCALVALLLAAPASGQSLPSGLVGGWDISPASCATEGTPVTRIDIASQRVETFGGNAIIREVEQIGAVTFAAVDFQQLEGVEDVAPRERTYFRFDHSAGPDRLKFVWKDIKTVDLFRCDTDARAEAGAASLPGSPAPAGPVDDGPLPILQGLWVIAGTSCGTPSDAAWRVYDGSGLRGAASTMCQIEATQPQGDGILFSQLCTATQDGEVAPTRTLITRTTPGRVSLIEGGEGEDQDFNWCGPQLQP